MNSELKRRKFWLSAGSAWAPPGDLFVTAFHRGYPRPAFVFTALICVLLIAWRLGADPV